jgi:hypothetical protein
MIWSATMNEIATTANAASEIAILFRVAVDGVTRYAARGPGEHQESSTRSNPPWVLGHIF